MKIFFISLCLVVSLLFQFSCAERKPPIEELEKATREYLAKDEKPKKVRGISLQPHPNNIYLITVEAENSDSKSDTYLLLGQLYRNNEESYWQVTYATPFKLNALGIKKAKDDEK